MGKIKDRNSKDLTEEEEIKKSWQEYTEKLYRKGLIDLDNHYSVATHLKPDILKYGVKWALESIAMNKDSGSDEIPMELSKNLKRWCC